MLTIFFFIAFNNLLGLIPVFPGGANLTGNIAVAMVMAAIVFIITTLSGTKYYWKHIFAMPGVPKPVLLILTPIEILGTFETICSYDKVICKHNCRSHHYIIFF